MELNWCTMTCVKFFAFPSIYYFIHKQMTINVIFTIETSSNSLLKNENENENVDQQMFPKQFIQTIAHDGD